MSNEKIEDSVISGLKWMRAHVDVLAKAGTIRPYKIGLGVEDRRQEVASRPNDSVRTLPRDLGVSKSQIQKDRKVSTNGHSKGVEVSTNGHSASPLSEAEFSPKKLDEIDRWCAGRNLVDILDIVDQPSSKAIEYVEKAFSRLEPKLQKRLTPYRARRGSEFLAVLANALEGKKNEI